MLPRYTMDERVVILILSSLMHMPVLSVCLFVVFIWCVCVYVCMCVCVCVCEREREREPACCLLAYVHTCAYTQVSSMSSVSWRVFVFLAT